LKGKAFFYCELSYDAGDGMNNIQKAGKKGEQITLHVNFNSD